MHTIPKVDQAFENKFTGATLSVVLKTGDPATTIPVLFFQEPPDPESYKTRNFTALSLDLKSVEPDSDRREGEQEGDRFKVGDVSPVMDPPQSEMLPIPTPYRLTYFLETWVLGRAIVDRALKQLVVERLGDRGILTLIATDPFTEEDEDVHIFQTATDEANEDTGDMRIYHRVFTYEVLVELGPNDVLTVTQVNALHTQLNQGIDEDELVPDDTFIVE